RGVPPRPSSLGNLRHVERPGVSPPEPLDPAATPRIPARAGAGGADVPPPVGAPGTGVGGHPAVTPVGSRARLDPRPQPTVPAPRPRRPGYRAMDGPKASGGRFGLVGW